MVFLGFNFRFSVDRDIYVHSIQLKSWFVSDLGSHMEPNEQIEIYLCPVPAGNGKILVHSKGVPPDTPSAGQFFVKPSDYPADANADPINVKSKTCIRIPAGQLYNFYLNVSTAKHKYVLNIRRVFPPGFTRIFYFYRFTITQGTKLLAPGSQKSR